MADRREFLQYAMVSAVPLATGLSLGTVASAGVAPVLPHVLIDSRHVESRAFGARLATAGAAIHSLPGGDATDAWLNAIGPAWRAAPMPVAGLTRPPALFILEQLAWSHGLRVIHHAEHVVNRAEPVRHQIHRSAGVELTESELSRAQRQWPHRVAERIASWPGIGSPSLRAGPTCAGLFPALPPGSQLLTSWLIAPV